MIRAVALVEGVVGTAAALRPDAVAAAVRGDGDPPPALVVRVLGARMAVQAAVTLARPDRRVALGGAAVDGLHAASMVLAARVWPRWRNAARTSAAVAGTSAALLVVGASR